MVIGEAECSNQDGVDSTTSSIKIKKIMYHTRTGSYDEIPEGMKTYINNYGCHFNKKLYEEAVSRMYKENNGRKEKIQPYTKEQMDTLLKAHNIEVVRNKLYDACYVGCMCKADYLGKSVPDEHHLAMFVKDMLDDPDAEEGFVFNRFYSDTVFMNNPIEWDDMLG